MHGRLTPSANGKIQSFPVEKWRDEFPLARQAGLACIEWIYEAGTDAENPLRTDDGVAEMCVLAKAHDVRARSVCADYYMSERLVADDGAVRHDVVDHLKWLLTRAQLLGAGYI